MKNSTKIVTRFAPSPTGQMHVGSYRTAFFSYLFAKKNEGKFVLRIEDTDKERSKDEYTKEIFEVFERIGISYDEKYIQSENVDRHKELLLKLIDNGYAYISKEEAKDGSGVIKDIVRFKNPNKVVTFNDLIRGEISTDTTDLGDFVIAKNINEPLFHMAVVADDYDEGITHVVRAEEHIANTPRQILIYEALGFDIPKYAHLPIVLAPDKTKLSKRKGAVPVIEYLDRGYLPEALLNAICLCGWNPGTEQEIFSRKELEEIFDLDKVQKSGAIFNEEKLNWFNREYIKVLSSEEFWNISSKYIPEEYLQNPDKNKILRSLEKIIRERIDNFSDIKRVTEEELDYFFETPSIDLDILVWKSLKDNQDGLLKTKEYLKEVYNILSNFKGEWEYASLKDTVMNYSKDIGNGEVLWPLRVSLSGKEKSPDPFEIASLIGKDKTLERISLIINK